MVLTHILPSNQISCVINSAHFHQLRTFIYLSSALRRSLIRMEPRPSEDSGESLFRAFSVQWDISLHSKNLQGGIKTLWRLYSWYLLPIFSHNTLRKDRIVVLVTMSLTLAAIWKIAFFSENVYRFYIVSRETLSSIPNYYYEGKLSASTRTYYNLF